MCHVQSIVGKPALPFAKLALKLAFVFYGQVLSAAAALMALLLQELEGRLFLPTLPPILHKHRP